MIFSLYLTNQNLFLHSWDEIVSNLEELLDTNPEL